jgi:hypothetical protein
MKSIVIVSGGGVIFVHTYLLLALPRQQQFLSSNPSYLVPHEGR